MSCFSLEETLSPPCWLGKKGTKAVRDAIVTNPYLINSLSVHPSSLFHFPFLLTSGFHMYGEEKSLPFLTSVLCCSMNFLPLFSESRAN